MTELRCRNWYFTDTLQPNVLFISVPVWHTGTHGSRRETKLDRWWIIVSWTLKHKMHNLKSRKQIFYIMRKWQLFCLGRPFIQNCSVSKDSTHDLRLLPIFIDSYRRSTTRQQEVVYCAIITRYCSWAVKCPEISQNLFCLAGCDGGLSHIYTWNETNIFSNIVLVVCYYVVNRHRFGVTNTILCQNHFD